MRVLTDSLSKSFGDPPTPALTGISLEAAAGSLTAIVGVSGTGKSTLLRILAGLTEPTSGSVTVGGSPPTQLRRRKEVGWMAQHPALLPWHTVTENVTLAQTINPQPGRPLGSPAELLAMVGLGDVGDQLPARLSGGMQQRAALARTLAIGAPLWLMDEPFSSLDELTREALATDLLTIREQVRPTIMWVTHHIPEAVVLADRVLVLAGRPGTIAGTVDVDLPRPRDITSEPFQEVVRHVRLLLRDLRPTGVRS